MGVAVVTPPEAYAKICQEGARYLDVRTAEEFAQGHAAGAINVPLYFLGPAGREQNGQFVATVQQQVAPQTKLVVGCASGGRSAKACALLAAAGFTDLANIDGGFMGRRDPATGASLVTGWRDAGLPVD